MLNRLAVVVVLLLGLNAISASAQNTIIDSNGAVVGNVVGVNRVESDAPRAVVARQDANGLWVAMELMADGFLPSPTEVQLYYTDPTCSTTPYLLVLGGTPLFRKLRGLPADQLNTMRYYAGDPVVTLTFQSMWNFFSSSCSPTGPFTHLAGQATLFDLTQFVPPFTVAPPPPPVQPTSPVPVVSPGHQGGQPQPLPGRSSPREQHSRRDSRPNKQLISGHPDRPSAQPDFRRKSAGDFGRFLGHQPLEGGPWNPQTPRGLACGQASDRSEPF